MQIILDILAPLYPFLIFVVVIFIFIKLLSWAKHRKIGALIFGLLTQMFMPDPYVDHTIQVVQESKKQTQKSEGKTGEPEI